MEACWSLEVQTSMKGFFFFFFDVQQITELLISLRGYLTKYDCSSGKFQSPYRDSLSDMPQRT